MQPPLPMCHMHGQHVPAIRALSASSTRPSQSLAIPFHKRKSVIEQRLLQGSDPAQLLMAPGKCTSGHYNFKLPLPECTGNGSICQGLTLPLQEGMLSGKDRWLLSLRGMRTYLSCPEMC